MKLWPCVKLSPVIFGGGLLFETVIDNFCLRRQNYPCLFSERHFYLLIFSLYFKTRRIGCQAMDRFSTVDTFYAHREGLIPWLWQFQAVHTYVHTADRWYGNVPPKLLISDRSQPTPIFVFRICTIPGYLSLAGWYIFRYLGTSYCTVQYNGTMRCRCITKMKAIGCIRWMSVILFQVRVH